jgi:pimeloyl-ACP methyl ester carboxylesterase
VTGAVIPGVGHFAMDEAPDAVIAEFLHHFAAA